MVRNIVIAIIAIVVLLFILVLAGIIELGDEAAEAVDTEIESEAVTE